MMYSDVYGDSPLQPDVNQPFFFERKIRLLWDPDPVPSPSEPRVLTTTLTHAAQKARTSSRGQPERRRGILSEEHGPESPCTSHIQLHKTSANSCEKKVKKKQWN